MTGFIKGMFGKTVDGLEQQMNLSWKRNQAITSNITNADTPTYKAIDLNFGRELEAAFQRNVGSMRVTDPRHLDQAGNAKAHLVADYSGIMKPDGNNVDIDLQMGRLASNSSAYSNAANLVRKKLTIIRNAIREASR